MRLYCLSNEVLRKKMYEKVYDGLIQGASEEELNSQIEAACTLVEKLITENAELVEKVSCTDIILLKLLVY